VIAYGILTVQLNSAYGFNYNVHEELSQSRDYTPPKWGYAPGNGPNTWPLKYPSCGGLQQSPVALPQKPDKVDFLERGRNNYNVPRDFYVFVNRRSLEFAVQMDLTKPIPDEAYINVTQRYSLYQILYHWGKDSTGGAEHSIAGRQYQMEVEYNFFDRKYGSPSEAELHPEGLMVNSVLFHVSNDAESPLLEKFVSYASELNRTTDVIVCPLIPYIPQWEMFRTSDYYTYMGSSSTPPCREGVRRNVFLRSYPISERQLNILRSSLLPNGEEIAGNLRPIQPYNGRKVTLVRRESPSAKHKFDRDFLLSEEATTDFDDDTLNEDWSSDHMIDNNLRRESQLKHGQDDCPEGREHYEQFLRQKPNYPAEHETSYSSTHMNPHASGNLGYDGDLKLEMDFYGNPRDQYPDGHPTLDRDRFYQQHADRSLHNTRDDQQSALLNTEAFDDGGNGRRDFEQEYNSVRNMPKDHWFYRQRHAEITKRRE